jgi:hypothetical protein
MSDYIPKDPLTPNPNDRTGYDRYGNARFEPAIEEGSGKGPYILLGLLAAIGLIGAAPRDRADRPGPGRSGRPRPDPDQPGPRGSGRAPRAAGDPAVEAALRPAPSGQKKARPRESV